MRIVVLAWRDPWHEEAGGSEKYLFEILRRLSDSGHDVVYVTSRSPERPPREYVHGIHYVRRGGRLTVYPYGLAWLLWHRSQVDLVLDVINGVPFASPLVRRSGVIALVHHIHREQWHLIYPDWRGRLGWWLESHLVPRLYASRPILTVSEATRADLVRLGLPEKRITVIRNAQDGPSEQRSAPRSPTPRLVCVGRLVPHKRVEHALDTVAQLAGDFPSLILDIVGEGYWRPQLQRHAAELGIVDRVRFHGHLSDEERSRTVERAWALLFPSIKEGWGLVITEAGSVGVPAVAYRSAGGVRESVQDGRTGLLVDSPIEFTAATRSLLEDLDLRERLGAQARETALARNWDSAAEEFAGAVKPWLSGRRKR